MGGCVHSASGCGGRWGGGGGVVMHLIIGFHNHGKFSETCLVLF